MVAAILVLGLCVPGGAAGPLQPQDLSKTGFAVTDVMIPARDGVRLNTKIFVPRDHAGPLPIIFRRTPYGVANSARNFVTSFRRLADEGYGEDGEQNEGESRDHTMPADEAARDQVRLESEDENPGRRGDAVECVPRTTAVQGPEAGSSRERLRG